MVSTRTIELDRKRIKLHILLGKRVCYCFLFLFGLFDCCLTQS
ncbi:hypothetical protein ERO13_A03G023933v2 [Gossypium hirsutum]|nr:hypothetical protein ERO13_A03G023933v2 [Gossypium hirsutum]